MKLSSVNNVASANKFLDQKMDIVNYHGGRKFKIVDKETGKTEYLSMDKIASRLTKAAKGADQNEVKRLFKRIVDLDKKGYADFKPSTSSKIRQVLGNVNIFGKNRVENLKMLADKIEDPNERCKAYIDIGDMYLHGHGVNKNASKAEDLYLEAVKSYSNTNVEGYSLFKALFKMKDDSADACELKGMLYQRHYDLLVADEQRIKNSLLPKGHKKNLLIYAEEAKTKSIISTANWYLEAAKLDPNKVESLKNIQQWILNHGYQDRSRGLEMIAELTDFSSENLNRTRI